MKLTPYLANVTDENALIGLYFVNDFVNSTSNQVNCSIQSFDTFDIRLNVTYDVVTNSSGVKVIQHLPYKPLMEKARCLNSSQCLMLCPLNSNGPSSNEIQTLFCTSKRIEVIQSKSSDYFYSTKILE
jgi:Pyruvate/2-oxoacid:ferredoxin oxidoreductase delta subunit